MTRRKMLLRGLSASILMLAILLISARTKADSGMCGGATIMLPFTDVGSSGFFCQIAAAYFTGITNGTTATTFNPGDAVTREQIAAFATRTLDQSLRRGSKRAVAQQWWTPKTVDALRSTSFPNTSPYSIAWDGADLWVPTISGWIYRVRASDGKILETWTTSGTAEIILVAAGRVFVVVHLESDFPGHIQVIDPTQPPGTAAILSNIPPFPTGITFDGQFLWTSHQSNSIARIPLTGEPGTIFSPNASLGDILWDGENLWGADRGSSRLVRIDPSSGSVVESIQVGNPSRLLFDGANIWVSRGLSNAITVVRAVGGLRGKVLATLSAPSPGSMAFDGERVMVVNGAFESGGVTLFKASDLSLLGSLSLASDGATLTDVCSDGLNFWITQAGPNPRVIRF